MSEVNSPEFKELVKNTKELVEKMREAERKGNADKTSNFWKKMFEVFLHEKEIIGYTIAFLVYVMFLFDWVPDLQIINSPLSAVNEIDIVYRVVFLIPIAILLTRFAMTQVKMARSNPASEYFHLDTYKKERPMEHRALYPLSNNPDLLRLVESRYLTAVEEKEGLREAKDEIEGDMKRLESMYQEMKGKSEKYMNRLESIYSLLHNVNSTFYSLIKKENSLHTVHLSFSYVLYKEEGKRLLYQGNLGKSKSLYKMEIPLSHEGNLFVRAFNMENGHIHEDGRLVWSTRFEDDSEWVFCIYTHEPWLTELLSESDDDKIKLISIQTIFEIIIELSQSSYKDWSDRDGNVNKK